MIGSGAASCTTLHHGGANAHQECPVLRPIVLCKNTVVCAKLTHRGRQANHDRFGRHAAMAGLLARSSSSRPMGIRRISVTFSVSRTSATDRPKIRLVVGRGAAPGMSSNGRGVVLPGSSLCSMCDTVTSTAKVDAGLAGRRLDGLLASSALSQKRAHSRYCPS